MYLFVEMWTPKPAWLTLSVAERQAYLEKIGPAMDSIMATGVEVIGWSVTAKDTPQCADFQYFGVWKMPDKEHFVRFENAIREAGWYDYFEQANLSGILDTPDNVVVEMVKQ